MELLKSLTAFCIANAELDELESLMSEFNLFEAAGLTREEIRHFRFLSFLLDPKGAPVAPVDRNVKAWETQVREGIDRFRSEILPKVEEILTKAIPKGVGVD